MSSGPIRNGPSRPDAIPTEGEGIADTGFDSGADVMAGAELAALYKFTDRLFRSNSETETYEAALDAILEAMQAVRASILRFDEQGVMRFVAWRGLSDEYRVAVDGHSPWESGARDAAPLVIADIAETDEPDALKEVIRGESISGLAFFPVTIDGAVIGKFMVYYEDPHAFTAREIGVGLTIARQFGFALERLQSEANLRRERELFEAVIERIPVMIKIYEPHRGRLHLNAEFARILGWSDDDAAKFDLMAELFPDPVMRAEVGAFMDDCPEGWLDVPMRTRSGQEVDSSWANIRLSDGTRVGIGLDITERQQALERQRLWLREMDHRIRNLFTLASGIVSLSAREAHSVDALVRTVRDRLAGLARAHALTVPGDMANVRETAMLHALIRAILAPYELAGDGQSRIQVSGVDIALSSEAVTNLALLLYEFATNAAKYGALTSDSGKILIDAQRQEDRLEITWREVGGPSIEESARVEGFGARLAQAAIQQLDGEFAREWRREGLIIRLSLPLDRLAEIPGGARDPQRPNLRIAS